VLSIPGRGESAFRLKPENGRGWFCPGFGRLTASLDFRRRPAITNQMALTAIQKIEKLGKAVAKMTQAELGRAVGVSRERIRQLYPRLKVKPRRRARA